MKKGVLLVGIIASFLSMGNPAEECMAQGNIEMEVTSQLDQNGADPWVLYHEGKYYYTKTTGSDVRIYCSDYLSDVAAKEPMIVYEENTELISFWAPELHYIDGGWYIYFAACTKEDDIHRMYVLENHSENPMEGEWICTPLKGMDDKFAIDGTVLTLNNEMYFFWSGWEGYENVQQNLYVTKMISPLETEESKILLSEPEYTWEKNGNPLINEGPELIVRNNTVNLVYSASGSWTNDYCLGLMTAATDADLCDINAWNKKEEPILQSDNRIWGPGHNGFAVSPDGTQEYLIYHSARWDGAGWNRSVRYQPMSFDENGELLSMTPLAENEQFSIPSGEPGRYRSRVEELELTEGLSVTEDENALEQLCISGFGEIEDHAAWKIELSEDGNYTVFVYVKPDVVYSERDLSFVEIEINGEAEFYEVFPSEYYQPVIISKFMKKGENTVIIRSDSVAPYLCLDRIEIMKN